jgi:hypothetical protein
VPPQVKALPPFAVKIHMGPGYPSRCPPQVTIQALWLSAGAIQRLQQQLGAEWAEQGPGTPICYTWVDWLKHSALDFLGASTALLVPGHALSTQGSPPASPPPSLPAVSLPTLETAINLSSLSVVP